jgi:predicted metal-dependent HD superfamily phosphohydrolase
MGLEGQWASLIGDGPRATAVVKRLLVAWRQPPRRYHTVTHLRAVLRHLDQVDPDGQGGAALSAAGLRPSGAARVAAWYHDAVYEPGRPGNEAASARLAEHDLTDLGWPAAAVSEVARLVLLTVEHRVAPGDDAGAWLCDADLAVLGGRPGAYGAYVAAVRAEYPDVDADGWRRGRTAVVTALLDRDRLYATSEGARRWERAARRNLTDELARLTDPDGPRT